MLLFNCAVANDLECPLSVISRRPTIMSNYFYCRVQPWKDR